MVNTLSTYGLTLTEGQTTPSRAGKAPRPVWTVAGMTTGYEDLLYRIGGKKWRGEFSFWSDPTEELLRLLPQEERQSFSERQEAAAVRAEGRAERHLGRAAQAEAASVAAHEKCHELLAPLWGGQPILVGHHSEAGHRKRLERADNAMRQAVEESDKAKHYERRASSAERTAERAAGQVAVGFMARRLKEAEAELRSFRRKIADVNEVAPDLTEEKRASLYVWKGRLSVLIREREERITHWKQQIEAAGGIQFAPVGNERQIKKGDYVFERHDNRPWRVVRVNRVSVTCESLLPYLAHCQPKIAYADIERVVTAEEWAAEQPTEGIQAE